MCDVSRHRSPTYIDNETVSLFFDSIRYLCCCTNRRLTCDLSKNEQSYTLYRCDRPMICKVTVHPGISGTVPIFNDMSRKKTVLLGHQFVPFLAWYPEFVPTFIGKPRLQMICSRMLTHRWLRISSGFICCQHRNINHIYGDIILQGLW